jgi:hypothetical protein
MARYRRKKSSRKEVADTEMVVYNSIPELYDHIRTAKRNKAWEGDSIFDNDESYLKSWCGELPDEAMEKFFKGDADAAKKIKAQGEILNEAQGGTMPKIEIGVYGCIPSVPNYLRGVPANMMRVIREPRRNPVIDIYVENSIYDRIDTNRVAEKAAIIANVIYATEMAGVRVNLYAVNTSHDHHDTGKAYAMVVKIKDADAPLNLLNIAFCVTKRAMHRSIFLKWLERHADNRIEGYGRPMRGNEIEPTFGIDGIILSMRDMVDCYMGIDDVTRKINEYLKNK